MEKGTWTVTLSDGSSISDLKLNGNNFISQMELTPEMFDGKLGHVVIEGPDGAYDVGLRGEHTNMKLVRCVYDEGLGGYAFVLIEMTRAELREIQIDSRLDYIEMMEGL